MSVTGNSNHIISCQFGKNTWKAGCFSLILPGVGQAYQRYWEKSVLFFLIYASLRVFYYYSYILLLSKWIVWPFLTCGLLLYAFSIVAGLEAASFFGRVPSIPSVTHGQCKNPWLAMFLSLILPGLGYVYIKKWHWALLSFIFYGLLLYFHWDIFFRIAFKFIVSIHVYMILMGRSHLKALSRFLLAVLLISLLAYVDAPKAIARFVFPVGIALGSSMEPTIKKGDFLFINRAAYLFSSPKRGDIVSIKPSKVKALNGSGTINSSKRVVAIGGDNVTFTKNELYVNGIIVEKSKLNYSKFIDLSDMPDGNELEVSTLPESITVPHNYIFVMGDNFDNSYDSRQFGAISLDKIDGKIIKIFGKGDILCKNSSDGQSQ